MLFKFLIMNVLCYPVEVVESKFKDHLGSYSL